MKEQTHIPYSLNAKQCKKLGVPYSEIDSPMGILSKVCLWMPVSTDSDKPIIQYDDIEREISMAEAFKL